VVDASGSAPRTGAIDGAADSSKPSVADVADRDLRLHIDRPAIAGDAALGVVGGAVIVEGWAEAHGGVLCVDIYLDGKRLEAAIHSEGRPEFAAAIGNRAAPERVAFACLCPAALLRLGGHTVGVELVAKTGRRIATAFFLKIQEKVLGDAPWRLRHKMPLSEIHIGENILSGLHWRPHFALIIGIGETDEEIAAAYRTFASLRGQAYREWRAVVLRRGRSVPENCERRLLQGFDDIADRVDIRLAAPAAAPLASAADRGRGGNRSAALIGVLLAGDVLGCDALLEMAIASGRHPDAELFYSDEYRVSPASGNYEAFLKPQWSPELLTATNYIGRFWCALPGVFERARAGAGEWMQFGDYDLVLRCCEATNGIHHVAKPLCERGRPQIDHPEQERAALRRMMLRRAEAGEIMDGGLTGYYRVKRPVVDEGLVSIIIPTCAADGRIKTCVETLRSRTRYQNFEIICVENIPAAHGHGRQWLATNVDKVVSTTGEPFNWSRFNNLAAQQAAGDFLVFLNDDVEIIADDWLDALLEHARRPEIGVVGARLLYPDQKIQHAGIFWTPGGGRHAFRFAEASAPGYFGLALTERNVLAVTGACMAMRRDEFDAMGGFDERHAIVNNDVDYCLRCWERGRRVVFTPHATLIHHEMASRQMLGDQFDAAGFDARWRRKLAAGDPFYHPYLSRDRDDYAYDAETVELVYPSRPLIDPAGLRNILAVKLDHIGDFITAIPALRRLRACFPDTRLHLLAAPRSAALKDLVPEVDKFIEFEFFFADSRLGQKELAVDDVAVLRERLAPYRFDLAIDLRKAPETRPVLQVSGARWLAGFDYNGQFPWLDIALEWEQDPRGMRKRTHVSEDLLRLVDAVAEAAADREAPWLPPVAAAARAPGSGGMPAKKRVCIHPGVGMPVRQWPAGYFAELILLLLAVHDVDIVLIGQREEAGIAAEILATVQRPDCVRSLVGAVELAELPALLANAALFVGNNSGPHHLAAGLGVPTVGIHSGSVDAREWGPVGLNTVAIRRNMVCSPCYFWDAADCRRGLACLTELRPAEVFDICDRLLAID
jgi:O-antigen biosynthesis protein